MFIARDAQNSKAQKERHEHFAPSEPGFKRMHLDL